MSALSEDFEIVEPNASALIESLRAFGYSPETAIADLIDNSVTAQAANIRVRFVWDGRESLIWIGDDGIGMDLAQLTNAMRIGSRNPTAQRDPSDLGRFGLGLKTASFSQCRELTVASKVVGGSVVVMKWDLDEVAMSGQWRVLKTASAAAMQAINLLESQNSGTIVIWETIDRIVGTAGGNDELQQRHFYKVASQVEEHLSMIFHRLIGSKLKIFVGSEEVKKWDPFLEGNASRQVLGTEKIRCGNGEITVEGIVLPHRSYLSESEYVSAGGRRGWNDLQGFYVYRNQRLLVAGDWLGLRFTKEEHYKLARVRIDIPNDMDDLWQIDVKKQEAVPPAIIRDELKRVADYTRQRAVEVYRHRGRKLVRLAAQGITVMWERKITHGKISYALNREHPIVKEALDRPSSKATKVLLRLIEETVPVPQIMIDAAENPEEHVPPLGGATPRQVVELAQELFEALQRNGASLKESMFTVLNTEPFNQFPELQEHFEGEKG